MTSEQTIPITIIAGFLGTGKTTLLNHILHGVPEKRFAVLVNDFGSINVDVNSVRMEKEGIVNLANGCICCSIWGDLQEAVARLARLSPPPDHILIEASGIADPRAVAQAFKDPGLRRVVNLDAILTLVDAEQVSGLRGEIAQLAKTQVSAADIILLNKIDLLTAVQLSAAHDWLQQVKPGAPVLDVTYGCAPLEVLLPAHLPAGECAALPAGAGPQVSIPPAEVESVPDHMHHPDHSIGTWTYTSNIPLQLDSLRELMHSLPGDIYRVKGYLYLAERPKIQVILQVVGRRVVLWDGGKWGDHPQTWLVFIGALDKVPFSPLQDGLEACQVLQ